MCSNITLLHIFYFMDKELIEYLSTYVTDNKWSLFQQKIQDRTRHLTVVVENLFQAHNISAVLRSADCFGLQDVHVIERGYTYSVNDDIALGASKWLNVTHYAESENNTLDCYAKLKEKGYKIVATTPHKDGVNLEDYDFTQKTALVFGTEKKGLSPDAIQHADAWLKVPMYGFTESFNISVCAAICMHHATWKLRSNNQFPSLSTEEKEELIYQWIHKVLKTPDLIELEYKKMKGLDF